MDPAEMAVAAARRELVKSAGIIKTGAGTVQRLKGETVTSA
jgi:hypothetical protein